MAEDASQDTGTRSGAGLSAAPPRSILGFALQAIGWGIAFFAIWYAVAQPLSLAAAWCGAQVLKAVAPVDRVRIESREGGAAMEVEFDATTAFRHRIKAGTEYEVPVEAPKFTYGIPFFVALLAASRAKRFGIKAACGATVLLVLASVGIACETALTLGTLADSTGSLLWKASGTGATLFALGFQLGTLIFPTVVPAALWVGMDAAAGGKVRFSS